MAPIPPKLYARDIACYSDAELDQYLEANGRLVEVEDPENLPEDFIQRLKVRAGASSAAQSRPIDLCDLTARLQHVSADRQARPRPPSLASDLRSRETTESIDKEEDYHRNLRKQTEYYNTLVNEGGRPSHPVSLGREVLEDPGEYSEILLYWQRVNHDGEGRVWEVFGTQMGNWRHFRRWQRKNRGDGRFHKYAEGVKQGLAEHGFTRPFQLDEDLEQQDKLTTWIEYLDYEYWWYDKDMRSVRRHQQRYDEAWKKLVDSKVLRTFETEEFICNIESAFQRASEEDQTEKAVESAKSAVMLAQKAISDPQRSILSQREPRQQLAAAQSKLKSIKRRNDLVDEFHKRTKDYQIAKHDAERRSILLRWMLQQVPLIELELKSAKVAENDSRGNIGVQRRSKRSHADESNEERVSKRQRKDGEAPNHRTRDSTAKEYESRLERSCHDLINEGRASKRLKRNGQNHTSIGESLSIQIPTTQDSRASTARNAKASSIHHSAPKKTRPEAKTPAKVVLDGKARVMKKGRRAGESSNHSTLGSSPRRSTRMRKPPDRFQ